MDPESFRAFMRVVPTPVTVVTTMYQGWQHGTTVSAFCSLSLRPPLVMVALDQTSDLLSRLRLSRAFGVNVLGEHQDQLARQFAQKDHDRFDGVEWSGDGGQPRLAGVCGWLVCDLVRLIDGGDHEIALGYVVRAEYSSIAPLVYQEREFGTHSRFAVPGSRA